MVGWSVAFVFVVLSGDYLVCWAICCLVGFIGKVVGWLIGCSAGRLVQLVEWLVV